MPPAGAPSRLLHRAAFSKWLEASLDAESPPIQIRAARRRSIVLTAPNIATQSATFGFGTYEARLTDVGTGTGTGHG